MCAVKSAGRPRYTQVSGPKCTSGTRTHLRAPNMVVRAFSVASRSVVTHAIWTGVWSGIAHEDIAAVRRWLERVLVLSQVGGDAPVGGGARPYGVGACGDVRREPRFAGLSGEPTPVCRRRPLAGRGLLDGRAGRQMKRQTDQCAVVAHADRAGSELLPLIVD